MADDVAVPEIETKKVHIGRFVDRDPIARRAIGSVAWSSVDPPVTDRSAIDPSPSRDLAVVPALGNQPEDLVDLVFGVHDGSAM